MWHIMRIELITQKLEVGKINKLTITLRQYAHLVSADENLSLARYADDDFAIIFSIQLQEILYCTFN